MVVLRNRGKIIKDYKLEFAALIVLMLFILLGRFLQSTQLVALGIVLSVILALSIFLRINKIPPGSD